MNRYISAAGLYARWNLGKIAIITAVTVLLAAALVWRYPIGAVDTSYTDLTTGEQVAMTAFYGALDQVIAPSRAPIVCAVGYAAMMTVMSLTGCGYGAQSRLTVGRLRVKEKQAVLLWAAYHAALLVVFWALLALALYGVMAWRGQVEVPELSPSLGPQSLMLLCYTDTFLHRLIPLRDTAVWTASVAAVLASALTTVQFAYRQRRGGFSLLPLLAMGGTVWTFFCPKGSSTNFLLMAGLLGLAGGALWDMLRGDDDANA